MTKMQKKEKPHKEKGNRKDESLEPSQSVL